MSQSKPSSRRETWMILALTALGLVVRLWSFDRLGLQHFDEGIYALTAVWIMSPSLVASMDPNLMFFAPPGLPILIGLCYGLTPPFPGISDHAAIAPALLCGVAMIPVAGWLGRRTFGPGAGVAASAFAALSGAHIAYSRMALTDSSFLLFWLLVMGAGSRLLERPTLGRAVTLGLLVGVAQNFKYHGWLAGTIVAATALLFLPDRRREAIRALALGVVAVPLSALIYLPWFRFVERKLGSYGKLLGQQKTYLQGWPVWFRNWNIQMAQSHALSGRLVEHVSWMALAALLAGLGVLLVRREQSTHAPDRGPSRTWKALLLPAAVATLGLAPNTGWWIGLVALPWLFVDPRPAVRLLAVWWLTMTVLTPLYHPYSRLWLPLHAVSWLLLAGLFVRMLGLEGEASGLMDRTREADRWPGLARLVVPLALALGLADGLARMPDCGPGAGLLGPSDPLRTAVGRAGAILGTRPVLLLSRPAVAFYLRTEAPDAVSQFSMMPAILDASSRDTLVLIDGVQLLQEPDPAEAWKSLSKHYRIVESWPVPLDLTSLLDVEPRAAYQGGDARVKPYERLWLLESRPQ